MVVRPVNVRCRQCGRQRLRWAPRLEFAIGTSGLTMLVSSTDVQADAKIEALDVSSGALAEVRR
ncbi:hypothetical protein BVI1335_150006 [Burkholderia vietnamiensis]|nr:hypothetical protein BVI1335_150006 [Burkholderia vietnamiensis]